MDIRRRICYHPHGSILRVVPIGINAARNSFGEPAFDVCDDDQCQSVHVESDMAQLTSAL